MKTTRKSPRSRFVPYEQAAILVRQLSPTITTQDEWRQAVKEGRIPLGVPRDPFSAYRHNGWISWPAFFGVERRWSTEKCTYHVAKLWVDAHSPKIRSQREWFAACKAGIVPLHIPSDPQVAFQGAGWVSWGAFLGTDAPSPAQTTPTASLEQAQQWAQQADPPITTITEWRQAARERRIPSHIPYAPEKYYREQGWPGWGMFLGTGRIRNVRFRPFAETMAWVQQLEPRIKSSAEWRRLCSDKGLPADIPTNPQLTYRDEWPGWGQFLGTGNTRSNGYLSMAEAGKWTREAGIVRASQLQVLSSLGLLPKNIPLNPKQAYAGQYTTFSAYVGSTHRAGTSFIERLIAREIAQFVSVDFSIKKVSLGPGKRNKQADIVLADQKVIIEYDGSRYHAKRLAIDAEETAQWRAQGWRVIRLREQPLPLINDDWDLAVPVDTRRALQTIHAVLRHMLGKGIIPIHAEAALVEYLEQKQFHSIGDALHDVKWWPIERSSEYLQKHGVRSKTQFEAFCRAGKLPDGCPQQPVRAYRNQWLGWGAYLNTGSKSGRTMHAEYWSIDDSSSYLRTHFPNCTSLRQLRQLKRDGKLPDEIPLYPPKSYRDRGWVSVNEFFGRV